MPRAELNAVILLCSSVPASVALHVYIDTKSIAEGIACKRTGGDNDDMWTAFWDTIAERELTITAEWVTSHCAENHSFNYKHSVEHDLMMGSAFAAMANRASDFAELLPGEAKPMLDLMSLLHTVLRRILATMLYNVTNAHNRPARPLPMLTRGRFPLPPYLALSGHTPIVSNHAVRCAKCLSRCPNGNNFRTIQQMFWNTFCLGHCHVCPDSFPCGFAVPNLFCAAPHSW